MATTQLLVRTTMMRVGDPGICMDEVNQQLCSQIFNGQFVTMLIVVLDLERGEMQVATAGHYPPLLNDGKNFRPVPLEPQIVLGVDAKAEYQTREFALPPGACILLYTDGVLDVESPRGNRFGKDGLAQALPNRPASARAVLDALLASIDSFRVAKDLPDDLTVVAIQLAATPASRKTVGARGQSTPM
jgi:sigma-B regulation protein RsbU (phosphoserine phosphatase)